MYENLRFDVDDKTKSVLKALNDAIYFKNISKIEELVAQGANIDSKDTQYGKTFLHWAVYYNYDEPDFKVIETLLKLGADDAQEKRGLTPLWLAAQLGTIQLLELLLNYNADINVMNNFEATVLFSAANQDDENVDIVQRLIDLGLNVNHRNSEGRTPFYMTLWLCDEEPFKKRKIMKCFLKNGADPDAIDNKGWTPICEAFHIFEIKNPFLNLSYEEIKNFFSIPMEHADWSLVNNGLNILPIKVSYIPEEFRDYDEDEDEDDDTGESWKLFLEHFAKLQSLNISVHPDTLNKISRQDKYIDYFDQCKEELLLAKNTKLKNTWITFHNLLVGDKKKLKNYAGNKSLTRDFRIKPCLKKFPIYGASMVENMKKGIKRRELFDKSATLLSEALPKFSPTHLVIRDVLDCILNKKDLSKLCE